MSTVASRRQGGAAKAAAPVVTDGAALESGANPRHAGFDGLRAVAALAIVAHHVGFATGAYEASPAGWFLTRLDAGVSVFFVLSGFLLYRPWAQAHLLGRPEPALGPYLRRRLLRVVPAYWVALSTCWLVLGTVRIPDWRAFLAYYGLAQVYSTSYALGGIVQAWSLSVELSFYLFLPAYAWAAGRASRSSPTPLGAELVGVAALFVVGLATRVALLATHEAATPATLWLPAQLDLFALGMGLGVLSAWPTAKAAAVRPVAWAGRHPGACWCLAGLAFATAALGAGLPRAFGELTDAQDLTRHLLYAAVAVLLVAPAVGAPDEKLVRRALGNRAVASAGVVSYGLFLWHLDWLEWLVARGTLGWVPAARFWSVLAAVVGLGLASAIASYALVERPALRRARRTVAGQKRRTVGGRKLRTSTPAEPSAAAPTA